MNICVIGAGIAGAACARGLVAAGQTVTVIDRGRVVGGRMASRRLPADSPRPRQTDLGASYFTAQDERFLELVQDWQQRGLAREWTDRFHTAGSAGLGEIKVGPVRWAAPGGLRSLVEDLMTGLALQRNREVLQVRGTCVDGEPYDAVVLAMPDPQALLLLDPAAPAAAALSGRDWSPSLALAAGFAERTWPADFDGAFVNDSAILTWVADDGRRRGDGAPVLVAHTTPAYAAPRLADPQAALPEALRELRTLLDLPAPQWSFLQRWTYAQPVGRRAAEFHLADGIGLCGDGWGVAKVEAAWRSGTLLGEALLAGG